MQQGSDAAQKLHVEAKECAGACGEAGGGDVKTYFIQALLLRKRSPSPRNSLRAAGTGQGSVQNAIVSVARTQG